MNMELMESLKKIATNKDCLKQIENSDCSLKDIYDLFKNYGFTGSYDVFEKDYEEIFNSLINEIQEEELSSVSGGKMNRFFSKSTATLLSALTLSTSAIPMSNASAKSDKSKSTNGIVNFVKNNPGKSLAILAAVVAVPVVGTVAFNKLKTKKIVVDEEYSTKMAEYCDNLRETFLPVTDDTTMSNTIQKFQKYGLLKSDNPKDELLSTNLDCIFKDCINALNKNHEDNDILDYILLRLSMVFIAIANKNEMPEGMPVGSWEQQLSPEVLSNIDSLSTFLIFFYTLKQHVTDSSVRMNICTSLKNKLGTNNFENIEFKILMNFIMEAFKENGIELILPEISDE